MIIITKYFVFLHVPKTGGTFVTKMLRELPREWTLHDPPKVYNEHFPPEFANERPARAHIRYDQVPPAFSDLPMLCFVRNPWDWYVSWYQWAQEFRRDKLPPSVWVDLFDEGKNDFKQTIRNCCTSRSFDHSPPGSRWQEVMREEDVDLFTAMYSLQVGKGIRDGRVEVGRFENLREDLLAFLERHEVPIDPAFSEAVRGSPKARSSSRGSYQQYYDEELRDLVASKSRLAEEYGYSFDPDQARAPATALDTA
jgi:hypothetical protein